MQGLNQENINEWLIEFDRIMKDEYGYNGKYSECFSHEEWLDRYEDFTPERAASDEDDDNIYYSQ